MVYTGSTRQLLDYIASAPYNNYQNRFDNNHLTRTMDRNMRHHSHHHSYSSHGSRSLPHVGGGGKGRHPGTHRLSPPAEHNNNQHTTNQHDDLISYIYESWDMVTKEIGRDDNSVKYYQEIAPRQLPNFRAFDLEEWWGRRLMQSLKRQQHHRS